MKKSVFRELHTHEEAIKPGIAKMVDEALEVDEIKPAKNDKKGSDKKNGRKYSI